MLIDCDTCTAGPSACGDCIVTHLFAAAPRTDLSSGQMAAVAVLAAGGLVPPLRLVTAAPQPDEGADTRGTRRPQEGPTGLGSNAQAG